jgi:hypothetical protein
VLATVICRNYIGDMDELTPGDTYRLDVMATDTEPKRYHYVISQELRLPGVELRTSWPVKVGSSQPTEHAAMEAGATAVRRVERAEP